MTSQTKRILLVEDSSNDAELILTSLVEGGLTNEVVVVRDGEEALNYLHKQGIYRMRNDEPPVVILLDLKLPKINGLEVLAHLKADPNLQWIPVVILTSSREEPDLVRCYELKTNAYVVKPINFQEFMQVVQQLGLFWTAINQPPPYPPVLMNGEA